MRLAPGVGGAPAPGGAARGGGAPRPPPRPRGPGAPRGARPAAARGGTDIHIAHGTFPVRPPLVPGHELAGVVASVGPGADGVRVGEWITTETDAAGCGEGAHCRAGDPHPPP